VRYWFSDAGGTWQTGLKQAITDKLATWEQVRDPASGDPMLTFVPGTEAAHDVELSLFDPNPDRAGSGSCAWPAPVLRVVRINDSYNTTSSSDWDAAARVALHEFGHTYGLAHTGAEASGTSVPPALTTCTDLATIGVGWDDDASLVNAGWSVAGNMTPSAPRSAGPNPGFERGTWGWKAPGASLGLILDGGLAHTGHRFAIFDPEAEGQVLTPSQPTVVTPAPGDPIRLEFQAAVSDWDGSTSYGGSFTHQLSWRRLAYADEAPDPNLCPSSEWPSGRYENEIEDRSTWLTTGTAAFTGWNGGSVGGETDWETVLGVGTPLGVPSLAWHAAEVMVAVGTASDTPGLGLEPPSVALDDVTMTIWND
jgi:hypothetical protein